MTMLPPTGSEHMSPVASQPGVSTNRLLVESLTNEHEVEVLAFLAERAIHTVVMAGHIRDNGIESSLNRGTFYACRNGSGELEGVALFGHATLIESRSEAALQSFAQHRQSGLNAHMIMGEQKKIDRFWQYHAAGGRLPRRICHTLLFAQQEPIAAAQPVSELWPATLDDLDEVMLIQSQMAFAESGVDPLEVDPEGFRKRCARRVEQKRVLVWRDRGRLIFKADVISDTPEVVYLEGVYVDPQDRGKGFGTRCMSQLSNNLLERTDSLCVFVNERRRRAQSFFEQLGFKLRSRYTTIFLDQNEVTENNRETKHGERH